MTVPPAAPVVVTDRYENLAPGIAPDCTCRRADGVLPVRCDNCVVAAVVLDVHEGLLGDIPRARLSIVRFFLEGTGSEHLPIAVFEELVADVAATVDEAGPLTRILAQRAAYSTQVRDHAQRRAFRAA